MTSVSRVFTYARTINCQKYRGDFAENESLPDICMLSRAPSRNYTAVALSKKHKIERRNGVICAQLSERALAAFELFITPNHRSAVFSVAINPYFRRLNGEKQTRHTRVHYASIARTLRRETSIRDVPPFARPLRRFSRSLGTAPRTCTLIRSSAYVVVWK